MGSTGNPYGSGYVEKPSPELLLLRATVLKLRGERKVMHEMLTAAGIRDDVLGDGVRTCLIGRLAAAIEVGPVSTSLTCTCRIDWGDGVHHSNCPLWK